MSKLSELVNKLLEDYDEGLYTLGETYWRLILLVEGGDEVDMLIDQLPAEFAEGWTAWARATHDPDTGESILLGHGEMSEHEQRAIDIVCVWLARHPDFTREN